MWPCRISPTFRRNIYVCVSVFRVVGTCILWPWLWRQYVCPKRQCTSTETNSLTSQKIVLFNGIYIYNLLNNTVRSALRRMIGWIVNNELGRIRKREIVAWFEAIYSFKTSVNLYQNSRCHSPGDNTVRATDLTPFEEFSILGYNTLYSSENQQTFRKRYHHLQSRRVCKQSSEDRTAPSHRCANFKFHFRSFCECCAG
jgi:hypothetical protein